MTSLYGPRGAPSTIACEPLASGEALEAVNRKMKNPLTNFTEMF